MLAMDAMTANFTSSETSQAFWVMRVRMPL
jgi:hypothetical protein